MNTVINGEYTSIPNDLIKDTSLSLGAFKVYAVMRSKRNDWKFYRSTLAKEVGCGLKSLNKYIDELVDAGWLQKQPQCRNNGGYSYVDYIVLGEKKSPTPAVKEQPKPSIVETPRQVWEQPRPRREGNVIHLNPETEDAVSEIFKAYPLECPVKGRSVKSGLELLDIEDLVLDYGKDKILSAVNNYVSATTRANGWFKSLSNFLAGLRVILETEGCPKNIHTDSKEYDVSKFYFVPNLSDVEWTNDCYAVAEKTLNDFSPEVIAKAQRLYPYAFRNYDTFKDALDCFYSACESVQYDMTKPKEED